MATDMQNLFFSAKTLGFYSPDMALPDDAVEVSPEVEAFLREVIVWGADSFTVSLTAASVTYPAAMADYVRTYNAPTTFGA
jgi:hypothetical protein